MKIVLFDFDCTLTKRDTLRPIAVFLAQEYKLYFGLPILYFCIVLAKYRIISDKGMKEFFLSFFLRGKKTGDVDRVMKKFLGGHLTPLLNPSVFDDMRQYLNNGDKVYIVSANFDFVLGPLIEMLGITGVISTRTEIRNGVFTGKIVGDPCKGKCKLERVCATFSAGEIAGMTAVGDDEDQELLEMAGHGKLVPVFHDKIGTASKVFKRFFDIICSLLGLLVFCPLMLVVAVLIKLTSRGPVIYSQKRVGLMGGIIIVYKFRTMVYHADQQGTCVTAKNDPRITPIGRFLRNWKLDELPQLINVIKGNMSFVGPRPDVPGFADKLQGEDRIILTMRPGITGPATLKYHDEDELLARQTDPDKYNAEIIYPDKVRINKEYVKNYSFLKDVWYILWTVLGRK